MRRFYLYIFIAFLWMLPGRAQGQLLPDTVKNYCISKSEIPVKIDGVLNDSIWLCAERTGTFWQQYPYDTAMAVSNTEVMMAYDDRYIYVAAICHDTFARDYVITSLKRDFSYPISDAFAIYIDPFDDRTNGFNFTVSPYGVQREGLVQNGGTFGVTTNWDNKWWAEVKRDSARWVVEMKIPFKTLRYKAGIKSWGINFSRNNQKINENSSWCFVPRNFNISTLAYTGRLLWDEAPKKAGLNMSLIPYLINSNTVNYANKEKTFSTVNAGFDAKLSVTPALNLDITVNPDFSQVDVDRQIINLTRFNPFFPEQRQFFIENSDLFANAGFSQIRPFFSRKIGLSGFVSGRNIPIIGGVRLSGKLNKNWRIGLMNIQTDNYNRFGLDLQTQNYTVAAVQRQVFNRSNISAILVNRQHFTTGRPDYNRIIGLDYNLASKDNRWTGKFFYHQSLYPDKPSNAFAHASYLSYSDKKWFMMWNHEYVGANYRADVGFVPRQEVYDQSRDLSVPMTYWRLEPEVAYSIYPKKSKIYKITPGFYTSWYADSSLTVNDVAYIPYIDIFLLNTGSFGAKATRNFTRLYFPIDVTGTGNVPLPVGGYDYTDYGIYFNSNFRKKLSTSLSLSYGNFYNGTKLSYSANIVLRKQPWGNFSLSYRTDEVRLPQPYNGGFLTLVGPRIEITFTRNLYLTTFIQYNTQARNTNINARLQWRFAPMSDIYIVYTDNYLITNERFAGITLPDHRIKNRGLVVKAVYWLGI